MARHLAPTDANRTTGGIPGLTHRQRIFVGRAAELGDLIAAATVAGYSDPQESSRYLRAQPHILAAIETERRRILQGEIGGLALAHLKKALSDDKMSAKDRFPYIKLGLQLAGHGVREDRPGERKALEDMSQDELAATIREAEAKLGQVTIDITPDNAPVPPADTSETGGNPGDSVS